MPFNGLSLLYGISISNVPYKRLDLLYYMCSTGGRVSTGRRVVTGVRVRYSMRWRWRCGRVWCVGCVCALCVGLCAVVVAVGLLLWLWLIVVAVSTGGPLYAVIYLTKHLNNGNI